MRNGTATATAVVCVLAAIAGCSGSSDREDLPQSSSAPADSPAPEWGPPESVARGQRGSDGFFAGRVAVLGDWAVASWEVSEGVRFGVRPGREPWDLEPVVPDAWPNAVAVGPDGTALVTWLAPRNASSDGRGSLFEQHLVDGRWSSPTRLGHGGSGPVEATIDRWGTMTVAWAPDRVVRVVSRAAGGSWGEVTRIRARTYVQNFDLAANQRGDVVLAWEAGGVTTAFRARDGEWTVGERLRSKLFYVLDLAVSLDEEGRALVMWGLDPDWEELEQKYLAWAVSGPDGTTWTSTSYLDERAKPSIWGVEGIALAVNSSGDVLAAWSTVENNGYAGHAARFDVDTGWTTVDELGLYGTGEALLTDAGVAVVAFETPFGSRQSWWYQHPGGEWERQRMRVGGETSFDATGEEMLMLDVSTEVVARILPAE
ncbi:hypothetical protein [Nocardioides bizhenqiangii]|uniref:Exo-alpha-sialidase n=1 Tax=Nocardioides bizhenqiangii TaxID=3095076 RepID=A0ABZ0ZWG2_9ACTN|nr:hypothetical protein [Nocardioides sp. HM61]WQQ27623.1 hypothetical protein SHK19_05155 [Nocardioides sp. HM61]